MVLSRFILRIIAATLGLSTTLLAAADSSSVRVSVQFNKTGFKTALAEIQEKSGLKISFSDKLIVHALPVTLKRENAPVEKVLQELLRPEGLEAIQTDEKLTAVVPGYSDIGMAKAFGRALSTGIRLGNKLDGAVLAGDEVRVPDWNDDDDHDLAHGLTDLIAAVAYFENTRRWSDSGIDQKLERLLRSSDPLVRAGAVLPAISNGMRHRVPNFNELMQQGLASSNNAERTGWALMFAASLEKTSLENQLENKESTLEKLAADPESSVRMVAALALMVGVQRNLKFDADGKTIEKLLSDRSMFVRQTPYFMVLANPGLLTRLGTSASDRRLQSVQTSEGIKSVFSDANPIARAVSLGFAIAAVNGNQDRLRPVTEYLAAADFTKDPWMGWIHKRLKPMLADDPSVPFAELRDAVLSTKRSHQVAAVALFGESLVVRQVKSRVKGAKAAKQEPIPDLGGLIVLSQSDWLWARFAGTLVDAMVPATKAFPETKLSAEQLEKAEERFRAALESPKESTRLIALLGVHLRKILRVQDIEGYKAEDQYIRSARSPAVAEMMLGTVLSGQYLSGDQILAQMENLLLDDQQRDAAESLMGAIYYGNQQIRAMKPEQEHAFWKRLAELILAQQDLKLEAALTARLSWGSQVRQKAVLPAILLTAQIETVLALCSSDQGMSFREEEHVLLLAERLTEAAEEEKLRKQLLHALHKLGSNHELWINAPKAILKVWSRALDGTPIDTEEDQLRILALLKYWEVLDKEDEINKALIQKPDAPVVTALQRSFSLVTSKKSFPQAATLVAKTVEIGRRKNVAPKWAIHCPTLPAAAEAALQAILESDRIDDKMEAWVLLVRSGDQPSVSILADLVNEGELPPPQMCIAINALTANTNLLPEWYGKTLLRLARDANQKQEVRAAALNSAGYFSKTIQEELEALVFDATLSEQLRTHAAHAAGTAEKTRVFQKAMDAYDAQPGYLVTALLDRAMYSLQAPGATEFVLRALPDKRVIGGSNAWMRFHSMAFSLTQERMLTAFKEPQKLNDAMDAIEKNWPEEGREDFKAHVLPHLQKVKQKIAELKNKVTPKKGKENTPSVRPPPPPDDF